MRRFNVTIQDYDTGEIIQNFMGYRCYLVAVGHNALQGTVVYSAPPRFVLEIGSGAVRRGLDMYDNPQPDYDAGITRVDEENSEVQ